VRFTLRKEAPDEPAVRAGEPLWYQPSGAPAHLQAGNPATNSASISVCRNRAIGYLTTLMGTAGSGNAYMSRNQPRPARDPGRAAAQAVPPAIQSLYAAAMRHLQAGRREEAERLLQQVLAAEPRHADSLHLLGVIGGQTGRHAWAADMISRAIAINPRHVSYHSNLGVALRQQGRLDEAIASFRAALDLRPDNAEAHNNLGIALGDQARPDEAVACFRRAIELDPTYLGAHTNLGNALKAQGRLDEAIASYHRAVALDPNRPGAHNNLGTALRQQGRVDAAVACFHRAIERDANYVLAHNNLGIAFKEQALLDDAAACFHRALGLSPGFAEAHNNLGTVLGEQARQDAAIACYRQAIALSPDFAEAHNNLGTALRSLQRLDEAVASYRRAVRLDPEYADAHNNLAMTLLAQGDLAAGWPEYEWRWQTQHMAHAQRNFAQPQWRGEPAGGRTLLIHAEQGLGDTLHFCRYGPLAVARGLRVMLEVPGSLVRLLRSLPTIDQVVARGEPLPRFDLHCPTLSLPLALGTTLETVPNAVPYLHPDAAGVAAWETRLAAMPKPGRRVGLVWAGNSRRHSPAGAALDARRSIAPEKLAPLFGVPGLHFVSLQKAAPAAPVDFGLTDLMGEVGDFADTAALIANLDLVISVDTAVAHLAAALGKPVWLLDRFDPDWRWLLGRRDSAWYPTLRIYRQPQAGDWDTVLAEVVGDLRRLRGG
jgi:tetratricopeptide (TPR) repeat protein